MSSLIVSTTSWNEYSLGSIAEAKCHALYSHASSLMQVRLRIAPRFYGLARCSRIENEPFHAEGE